jgi:hypothetical protein
MLTFPGMHLRIRPIGRTLGAPQTLLNAKFRLDDPSELFQRLSMWQPGAVLLEPFQKQGLLRAELRPLRNKVRVAANSTAGPLPRKGQARTDPHLFLLQSLSHRV